MNRACDGQKQSRFFLHFPGKQTLQAHTETPIQMINNKNNFIGTCLAFIEAHVTDINKDNQK